MLVLTRRESETVTIKVPPSHKEQIIEVMLVAVRSNEAARLGFAADLGVIITRTELLDQKQEATNAT